MSEAARPVRNNSCKEKITFMFCFRDTSVHNSTNVWLAFFPVVFELVTEYRIRTFDASLDVEQQRNMLTAVRSKMQDPRTALMERSRESSIASLVTKGSRCLVKGAGGFTKPISTLVNVTWPLAGGSRSLLLFDGSSALGVWLSSYRVPKSSH